jgi:hypothetical protein
MSSLLASALDRPIAFHRSLVGPCGSIYAAILLGQAIYWTNRLEGDKGGWFYKTAKEWEDETALTTDQQATARKLLVARGLLEEKRQGLPCQLYFRVNLEAVETSFRESTNLDGEDPGNQSGKIPETLETTTETTTETTKCSLASKAEELADFERRYAAYPKKLARGDALKAWKQTAKQRPPTDELLVIVAFQAASTKWADKQYIPYPASYLRGQRWQDDLSLYLPAGAKGPVEIAANQPPRPALIRKSRRPSGLVLCGPVGPLHEHLTESEWLERTAELSLGPWPEGDPE